MRANVGAQVTLDTFCCIPCGNVNRNTAFFKCGGAKRNCAVLSACEYGYRQQVALQCVHGNHQLFNIFGKNLLDCFLIYVLCNKTNAILQSAFFKLANIIPVDDAVTYMKAAIVKSYGKKGEKVVNMNYAAVDAGLSGLTKIDVPASWKGRIAA